MNCFDEAAGLVSSIAEISFHSFILALIKKYVYLFLVVFTFCFNNRDKNRCLLFNAFSISLALCPNTLTPPSYQKNYPTPSFQAPNSFKISLKL